MDCKGCSRKNMNCNPPFRCYGYLKEEKPMENKIKLNTRWDKGLGSKEEDGE